MTGQGENEQWFGKQREGTVRSGKLWMGRKRKIDGMGTRAREWVAITDRDIYSGMGSKVIGRGELGGEDGRNETG